MEIVYQYYHSTPNSENQKSAPSLKEKLGLLSFEEKKEKPVQNEQNAGSVVDVSILSHVLDLLCSLLKNAKTEDDKAKVIDVFPKLLEYVEKSDDMFLLLNGT